MAAAGVTNCEREGFRAGTGGEEEPLGVANIIGGTARAAANEAARVAMKLQLPACWQQR